MGWKRNASWASAACAGIVFAASCGGDARRGSPDVAQVAESPAPSASATANVPPATPTPPIDWGPKLAEAAATLLEGHTRDAISQFRAITANASGTGRVLALTGLARALGVAGESSEAESVLRTAVTEPGATEEAMLTARFALAYRLAGAGKAAEIPALLAPFLVAPVTAPLRPYALAELGEAAFATGAASLATPAWDALLATPDLPPSLAARGWRGRAAVAWAAGDSTGYFAASARSLESGESTSLRLERGRRFLASGESALGVAEFRTLMVSFPASGNALAAYRELQKLGAALPAGQAALVLYRNGLNTEAVAVFATGADTRVGLDGAMAAYYAAAALEDLGDDLRAVAAYDLAVRLAPDSDVAQRARYWAARIMEEKGDLGGAASRYEGVAANPAGEYAAEGAFRAGYMAYLDGRPADAAAGWERLAAIAGARNWYWVGKVRAAAGDAAGARIAWDTATWISGSEFYSRLARSRLEGVAWPGSAPFREAVASEPDWLGLKAAAGAPASTGLNAAAVVRALASVGASALALAAAAEACDRGTAADAVEVSRAAAEAGLASASVRCALSTTSVRSEQWSFPLRYVALLNANSSRAGLDALLVGALIRQESLWQADAGSSAGAVGLAQLILPTAEAVARQLGLPEPGVEHLKNPELNIRLGVKYLEEQIASYGAVHIALAAYNAGPGNAVRWMTDDPDPAAYLERISFSETRAYVEGVLAQYAHYTGVYRTN